ncbi:MAG: hypothetical protein EP330_14500 [Deltaproteobacteria bacterium]|nr:MAG: hypothetical protein EP330_14500 [Deltaproteobacteria bacterium]
MGLGLVELLGVVVSLPVGLGLAAFGVSRMPSAGQRAPIAWPALAVSGLAVLGAVGVGGGLAGLLVARIAAANDVQLLQTSPSASPWFAAWAALVVWLGLPPLLAFVGLVAAPGRWRRAGLLAIAATLAGLGGAWLGHVLFHEVAAPRLLVPVDGPVLVQLDDWVAASLGVSTLFALGAVLFVSSLGAASASRRGWAVTAVVGASLFPGFALLAALLTPPDPISFALVLVGLLVAWSAGLLVALPLRPTAASGGELLG